MPKIHKEEMIMQRTFCDECNEMFEIKGLKNKRAGLHKGQRVSIKYFECPHCNAKYPYLYENNEIKKIMRQNAKLQERVGMFYRANDQKNVLKFKQRINKNKEKARSIQTELKERFAL